MINMNTTIDEQLTPGIASGDDERFNFLDVLVLLAKRKKQIAKFTFAIVLITIAIVFLMPETFTATCLLVPPQQSQNSALGMLAQLNPMAAGLGKDLVVKNTGDLYVAMLKSRTVADNLIDKFDLRAVYGFKTYRDARAQLEKRTRMKATKEGVIEISVDDRKPDRAADIANAYVAELQKLTVNLAITEASQRRIFYESQLLKAKDNLSEAEVLLKQIQEKTGLIQLDAQSKAIISAAGSLRAQVAAKEVQLERMRMFATQQNPDLQSSEQELNALRAQLAIVERKGLGGDGSTQLATSKVPAAGLEYIRQFRNVKYHETMFELLAKQFEVAKLDEAKNSAIVQVLDNAVPPERRSSPKRVLTVFLAGVLACFLAISWAIFRESMDRMRRNPVDAERLHQFKAYLFGTDGTKDIG